MCIIEQYFVRQTIALDIGQLNACPTNSQSLLHSLCMLVVNVCTLESSVRLAYWFHRLTSSYHWTKWRCSFECSRYIGQHHWIHITTSRPLYSTTRWQPWSCVHHVQHVCAVPTSQRDEGNVFSCIQCYWGNSSWTHCDWTDHQCDHCAQADRSCKCIIIMFLPSMSCLHTQMSVISSSFHWIQTCKEWSCLMPKLLWSALLYDFQFLDRQVKLCSF